MKLKPGTKFKLECEINARGQVVVDGDLIYDSDGDALCPELLREREISDVRPPPRERWTDPAGNVYEILRAGDRLKDGDLSCWKGGALRPTYLRDQVVDEADAKSAKYMRLVRP